MRFLVFRAIVALLLFCAGFASGSSWSGLVGARQAQSSQLTELSKLPIFLVFSPPLFG